MTLSKAFKIIGLCLLAGWSGLWAPAEAYDLRDNVIDYSKQGVLLMNRGRYAEAVETFKIALQLNPYSAMSAPLYSNLGISYRYEKNYPLAIVSLQRAMRIQPNFELYYKNLIETYADAGLLSRAINALKETTQRNTRDSEAWFLLGLAYEKSGSSESARQAFSAFLSLEPNGLLAEAARAHL